MEQRIILNRCERELEEVADEVWHHGTTPAPLWLPMRTIWNRHVVGELEGAKPFLFAVHGSGSKSLTSQRARVVVDSLGPYEELVSLCKQTPIVVNVV